MNLSSFSPKQYVACDTETTGLRPWNGDRAFSVALCDEEGGTWYCEWPVDPFTREVFPEPDDVCFLQRVISNPNIEKVFHNAKFDVRMLSFAGIETIGPVHDTTIAARVCNNIEFSLGLKPLAAKYLGFANTDESDLKDDVRRCRRMVQKYNRELEASGCTDTYKLAKDIEADYWLPRFFDPTNDKCQKYCEMDTVRTMGLHIMYQGIMEEDSYLRNSYAEEMRLWHVINKMEIRGVRISESEVRAENIRAHQEMENNLQAMRQLILENNLTPFPPESGKDQTQFNPGSTPQLRRILYLPVGRGGLGLATKRESMSGEMSTDKKALRELMDVPFVRHLFQYRAAEQAIGLFFEKYLDLMVECPLSGEKILHPGFNQCGTVTFRLSGSDPNLQQVGNPKTAGNTQLATYQPRAPFGPREGYFWYTGDYAQQELRIFADIGKIPFLLNEIAAGNDPNSACANKAWGGKNNPAALKAASYTLDLGNPVPGSPEIAAAWEELGWNATAAREFGFASSRSHMVADEWLAKFDYDIVKAEKSLGKSNSRGRAKCVVFAKIYGGGPSSVTELLYCSLAEAKAFLSDYDRAIPEINTYMSLMIRQAKADGFIVNPYGRKIRIEKDFSYRAVNYMIQSTAACMMKDSIVRSSKYLEDLQIDGHVILSIHDELIWEIHQADARRHVLRGLVEIMGDNQGRLSVPMPVELKRVRQSWAVKEDVEL